MPCKYNIPLPGCRRERRFKDGSNTAPIPAATAMRRLHGRWRSDDERAETGAIGMPAFRTAAAAGAIVSSRRQIHVGIRQRIFPFVVEGIDGGISTVTFSLGASL